MDLIATAGTSLSVRKIEAVVAAGRSDFSRLMNCSPVIKQEGTAINQVTNQQRRSSVLRQNRPIQLPSQQDL